MILFVGKQEKGFFAEEQGVEAYIAPALHIETQADELLKYKEKVETIIYDIEQYADEPEEIVLWIRRIEEALKIRTIIFAAGYSPRSTIIKMLWEASVKNFIFSIYLGEQKADLEYCLSGYFENFGYEEKRGISFEDECPGEE